MSQKFDAIVIGAGQAGPPMAGRLTAAGKTVAIIERKLFGGTCVNTGCTPTKTLIGSAAAIHAARRGSDYGFSIDAPIKVDMKRVKARADQVSGNSRNGVENWLRGMERCTVLTGHARFTGPKTVTVNNEELTAPLIFVNVGGRALLPDMPGVRDVRTLNNSSMLMLEELPRHLVVVGGSYIGLEFAQMYRRFGSEVTVVERMPRLVSREDEDVSDAIREILEGEGIAVRLDSDCISFAPRGSDISVGLDCKDAAKESVGSHVLLAVGRRSNTDDLGLDAAGIELDKRGNIVVDDALQTNVEGVYALGDCNGRGAFTHTAYNDFEIVAANLLDGAKPTRKVSDRIPGYALYTDPPLGRVGMNETEARRSGKKILVSKRPMTRVSRAIEKGDTRGFMKLVADADTKKILGAAILGLGGDEAIHGILDMMNAGADYTTLQWAVPIHPTVSELIPTLIGDLKPAV
jgi:pyruvate/2-oxoglutarate dehydrogenase complex dihydrolipoamide dehydrogenase (E3) component